MGNEKLKECPWERYRKDVAHNLHVVNDYPDGAMDDPVYVICDCGAQGPFECTVPDAIAAWNTRALNPREALMYEALKGWQDYLADSLNSMDAKEQKLFFAGRVALAKAEGKDSQ
jgi:hypothetical protein